MSKTKKFCGQTITIRLDATTMENLDSIAQQLRQSLGGVVGSNLNSRSAVLRMVLHHGFSCLHNGSVSLQEVASNYFASLLHQHDTEPTIEEVLCVCAKCHEHIDDSNNLSTCIDNISGTLKTVCHHITCLVEAQNRRA